MNTTTLLRGGGLLLIAATAWGGLFPVAMVTLPVLDPFHMTAIRYGITALIFVALLTVTERSAELPGETTPKLTGVPTLMTGKACAAEGTTASTAAANAETPVRVHRCDRRPQFGTTDCTARR